jgi:uncharacterized protein (TIGR03083 family)
MRTPEPILIAHLFAPLHEELLALLRSLSGDDWHAPTVAGEWTVKDVTAHLLDTSLRRLSIHRDGYLPPGPFDVHGANANGVRFARSLSPKMLIDQHERYGAQLTAFLGALDPFAPAKWGVSWAGEDESPMWFDVARELTERWHHQQQIRDAVGRPPLYDVYLAPVLETFVRALPFTYRDVDAPDGTSVVLAIDDAAWTLSRESSSWRLYAEAAPSPAAKIALTGDTAWRLFTKQKLDPKARIEGDAHLAEPTLRMVSVL